MNEVVARKLLGPAEVQCWVSEAGFNASCMTLLAQRWVFNKLTDGQRNDQEFRDAFYAKRDFDNGTLGRSRRIYERSVLDDEGQYRRCGGGVRLVSGQPSGGGERTLRAFLKLKELRTGFSLFYASWLTYPHWTDGRLHPEFHQCRAVTRRHSSSAPTCRATAHGEGAKIREALVAPDEWIHWSLDLSSQELLHPGGVVAGRSLCCRR